MSSQRRQVVVRDLVEEGKKRIVFLAICVVGLSYLMSLTSSSVWVNLPAAASLIVIIRYVSLDFEMRKKAAIYNSKPSPANNLSHNKPLEYPKAVEKSNWRRKVNSPIVENAIDHFTKHLVSEWVTNLWYSRLTPDKEGPEELVQIINGVLGEISGRMRNINLIDFLTRDLINLICSHLERFRTSQAKMIIQPSGSLTIEYRDMELRRILAAENKLHPALFSPEAEHKVLQHLMDGLISFTFKPEDLQCSFFRFVVRELLACAVMRPVLNLASPRFINERIEAFVISRTKSGRVNTAAEESSLSKSNGSSRILSDHFSKFLDPSGNGVELVQLKADQSKTATSKLVSDSVNGPQISKDPLLSVDTRSSRSFGSLPMNPQISDGKGVIRHLSGGEWGDMLDLISLRKTQVLAPENFENMWAKGKNYKKKEDRLIEQVPQNSSIGKAVLSSKINSASKPKERDSSKILPKNTAALSGRTDQSAVKTLLTLSDKQISNSSSVASYSEDDERSIMTFEEASTNSDTSEDEENGNVTGIGSPGTKVWDGKSNRTQAVAQIHHPLENFEGHNGKKTGRRRVNHRSATGVQSSKKSKSELPIWQEIERTSFLSGDGLDVLNSPAGNANAEESSDDSETENFGRVHSGAAASSSATSSIPGIRNLNDNSMQSSLLVDSFYKLNCEVLGANIVKSDSRTFAVYSISVTDVNNNSWSIKRRFRHFEELHRRLKEYPEYNLHLPPKHFLSTGLDVPIIRERCKLLDKYLKKLLQLPTISGSIEVWDFLCVDSQTYLFSNSFSILQTLSVDLDDKPSEAYRVTNNVGSAVNPLSPRREYLVAENKGSALPTKHNVAADGLQLDGKGVSHLSVNKPIKDDAQSENSSHDPEARVHNNMSSIRPRGRTAKQQECNALPETSELLPDAATDQSIPTEWVPPNLTIPILDLVDAVFQLHDGGWIRRKTFWVAKQILHLGMGDAVDDWLLEKIQLLRKGSVVASGIQRVEQILWPDGIFITKHPKRQRPPPPSPSPSSPSNHQPEMASPRAVDEQQKLEADRRAKFVYELMIENAPAGIVSLIGRREYEQCAKDLYFFIQSSVCLKQLVFDLVELLLVSAFPEMDYVFKQLHEEKHRFGDFVSSS